MGKGWMLLMHNAIQEKTEKKIERFILMVEGFYMFAMLFMSVIYHWPSWIIPVAVFGYLISLYVHIKSVRTYEFRANVITTIAMINYLIYGIFNDSFLTFISSLCVAVVFLSLFRIEKLIYKALFVTIFLNIYHLFIAKTVQITDNREWSKVILQCMAIYVIEAISYYLIRSQKATTEAMFEAMEAIKEAEQSKDDFMANLSHEIRTPVNTVVGMTEMILHENVSDTVQGYAANVQTAGRNLLSVVSDVLDFSELQSGKIVITEEPYNLSSTINDILNMTIAQRQDKNIDIVVDCDPKIPCGLVGDEQKIRRVILNIISNAIKFTESGAVVLQISMRRESNGINLIVNVRDTGIGIREENLEHLFDSFNQVDTKRNRQEGGIGLGLAISKAIIDKMNGFINITSEVGVGTQVRFVIPQKVEDPRPMIKVENAEDIHILYYLRESNIEHKTLRDEYTGCIRHMQEQLELDTFVCRNLAELKRRAIQPKYTHVFLGWREYTEDREYFDSIQEEITIVLIMEEGQREEIGSGIRQIHKPFYTLSVATALNGGNEEEFTGNADGDMRQFVAPQASILVVDDNVMNLKVLEGFLRPYKVKVFVAESGREALEKLSKESYDFVFMDHMMPEMDGVECFHRIRQRPGSYFQKVPVVALTANAIAGAREMFLAEGFQDFVAKPVEISSLERVLRKFIPQEKIISRKEWEKQKEIEERDLAREEYLRAMEEEKEAAEKEDGETEAVSPEVKTEEAAGKKVKDKEAVALSLQEALQKVEINIDAALSLYGGEMDFYKEMLEIFVASGPNKRKEVQSAFEKEDWEDYTILVHSVKGNAASVGAEKLSQMAKKLEMAGKEDNISYIKEQHAEMMEKYEWTINMVEEVMKDV